MPQIVSLLPAASATPATPAATSVGPAATSPVGLQPADLTSPNFLAQFKSALKSLANAVVLPSIVTPAPAAAQTGGPLMAPLSEQASEDRATSVADKPVDANLPALLAELGFAIVPTAFVTLPSPNAKNTVPAGAGPQLQALAQADMLTSHTRAQHGPPVGNPAGGSPAQVDATAPVATSPPAQAAFPIQPAPADLALAHVPTQTPPASAFGPLEHLKLSDLSQPQLQPAVQPQVHSEATPPVTTQPTLAVAAEVLSSALQQPDGTAAVGTASPPPTTSSSPVMGLQHVSQGSSQHPQADSESSGGNKDHGRHVPADIVPVSSEPVVVPQSAPLSDAAMVAAAAATARSEPQVTPVGPSAVVSQIARHADLIRLPGNRGLRIQLHPDDLGGVQVTVRYSPAGGVELHINAEHAATGALVQAGWAELRDSLATQGISADRLIMNVTSSSGAGQTDLSGRGGSGSDPSAYSSSQTGQGGLNSQNNQGQPRQEPAQQRGSQNWSGPLDPIPSPDGDPRVAAAAAHPSRIDYRA